MQDLGSRPFFRLPPDASFSAVDSSGRSLAARFLDFSAGYLVGMPSALGPPSIARWGAGLPRCHKSKEKKKPQRVSLVAYGLTIMSVQACC